MTDLSGGGPPANDAAEAVGYDPNYPIAKDSLTIHIPSSRMETVMAKIMEFRSKADSEKITINVGYVDLGHIDLLVRDGFFSNRTDFIRTAVRNQLERHAEAVSKSIRRQQLDLGIRHISRRDLEEAEAAGEQVDIRVLGLATIAGDVTPELALKTIASLTVLGALQANAEVKAALAERIQ